MQIKSICSTPGPRTLCGTPWFWGCAALILGVFAYILYWYPVPETVSFTHATVTHLPDDVMVTLRVAENFWQQDKPYLNLTQNPLAANTSLIWPMLLSQFLSLVDHAHFPFFVSMLSIALSLATAVILVAQPANARSRLLFLACFLISSTMLGFAATGFESIPQMLAITAAFVYLLRMPEPDVRHLLKMTALMAVAFVLRPDAGLLYAMSFYLTIQAMRREKASFKSFLLLAATGLLPVIYLLLMLYYYGDIVPNTYYLKMYAIVPRLFAGGKYVLEPYMSGMAPILLVFVLCCWRGLLRSERLFALMGAAQLVYVVYLGGDFLENGRFMLPLLPACVWVVIRVINRTRYFVPAAFILLAFDAYLLDHYVDAYAHYNYSHEHVTDITTQVNMSRVLRETLDPSDGSIGLHYLGMSYWLPDFHIVDFLGKADSYIAHSDYKMGPPGHNKWDYSYSLSYYSIAAIPNAQSCYNYAARRKSIPPHNFMFCTELSKRMQKKRLEWIYVAPEQFCFPSTMGLYVRRDLLGKIYSHPCVRPPVTKAKMIEKKG